MTVRDEYKKAAQSKSMVARVAAFITLLIALSFMFGAMAARPVAAQNENELEKIRKVHAKKRARLKEELTKKRMQEKGALRQIDKVQNELYIARRDLNRTVSDLKKNEANDLYLEKLLQNASRDFDHYRKQHEERLVAYYKNGHAGYLEVMLNSSSFSDFISRIYYLQLLTKHDLEVMTKLKALRKDMQTKRELVQKNLSQMTARKRILAERKAYQAELHKIKQSALKEIQTERGLLEQELAQLRKEDLEIENQLRRARGSEPIVPSFTGRFASPICGRSFYITSPFGPRKNPTRRASTNHKGLDLRARYGTDICAAADGVVFTATRVRGYGRYIVIQHGNGYATVYAHAKKLLVKKGDKVKKGQVIMKADSSGYSTGSHLHFEIRKNGKALDPSPFYCGGKIRKAHTVCR